MESNSHNNGKNNTLYLVMSLQFFHDILYYAKPLSSITKFERTDFCIHFITKITCLIVKTH